MREWILLAVMLAARPIVAGEPTPARSKATNETLAPLVHTYRTQGWLIYRTSNFRVCSRDVEADYTELAKRCETLRSRLQMAWFGEAPKSSWSPRCDVIVHASLLNYRRASGPGVGQSVGFATLKIDGERVAGRRIDIRLDADNWSGDALPHELSHVVLADRFLGKHIPHWANEGMSVLAESTTKQSTRIAALQRSLARGLSYETADLFQLTTFPRPGYHDAFYGQSALAVRSLVERGTQRQFLNFIEVALDGGYDHALQKVYKIQSIDKLERLLREDFADLAPIWELSQPDLRTRLAVSENQ